MQNALNRMRESLDDLRRGLGVPTSVESAKKKATEIMRLINLRGLKIEAASNEMVRVYGNGIEIKAKRLTDINPADLTK